MGSVSEEEGSFDRGVAPPRSTLLMDYTLGSGEIAGRGKTATHVSLIPIRIPTIESLIGSYLKILI